jgi:subtilisin
MIKAKKAAVKGARTVVKASTRSTATAAASPIETVATLPPFLKAETGLASTQPATTGRFIVIYKQEASDPKTIRNSLSKMAGLKSIPASSDFNSGAISSQVLSSSEAVHFEKLGMAVVSGEDEVTSMFASISDAGSPILTIEPEYIAYLSFDPQEYLRGYKDAINQIYEAMRMAPGATAGTIAMPIPAMPSIQEFQDTNLFTWGLQATKVNTSPFTGKGIKIAVLDTGFDFQHMDFRGRSIISESFSGETVSDVNSHGTHCIGTACGPQNPASGVRRYGIAFNAQIFVGKVFNNAPRPAAPTTNVLAGIEWALINDCDIASLSLGVAIDRPISQYETPLRRALNAGLLIVAAAGNNAMRPSNPGFVEPPANSHSALAVGAIDNRLEIAAFSARSSMVTGVGGSVNIVGPGVGIFSSIPTSLGLHNGTFNGTSMATPHVAGIAALWAEATGDRGTALWSRLMQTALALPLPSLDVGMGLVQAPQ